MITGAGGAFGAVIKATPIADYIKTLIGDGSAVAGPVALLVLPALGLDATMGAVPIGQVLAVMAIGAGAMVVSHVNDSYFWVVTQFSGMSVQTPYRAHTAAPLVQGASALTVVLVLGAALL